MTSPAESSAQQMLKEQLDAWGLGVLYKDAAVLLTQGLDSTSIMLSLQNTDAYQKRFSANEERRKAGLQVLSPAEYVALETQYKTVMRTFGLPAGFYDSIGDLSKFIANDVSPTELTERASVAQSVWLSSDQYTKDVWTQWHGLSNGAAIAAILDPDVALPIVERMKVSAQIGGAAARNGLTINEGRANEFADLGVDPAAALGAYSDIAARSAIDSSIAKRFDTTLTQREQEDDAILGLASAKRKRDLLHAGEANLFDARAGATATSLGKSSSGRY